MQQSDDHGAGAPAFLASGGEMGALIAGHDWSATRLGPIGGWPQSLKSAVGMAVASPLAMIVLWGPDLTQIYNDGYRVVMGRKHPSGLGQPTRECWPEVWHFNAPVYEAVRRGEARAFDRVRLTTERHGALADDWFDLTYSPLRNEAEAVAGVLVTVIETTERVLAEARLRASETRLLFLDRLAAETAPLLDADAVLAITTRLLGEHLNLSVCAYADMDEDQDGFTIRGDWAAPGSTSIVGHYSLADFGRLAVTNLSAGEPLIVNDNLRELAPEEAAAFQDIGISATICMPLVKTGRLTALMAIHDKVPRAWSADELNLIREVTERSWAHVERVGAEAGLRASEEQFRAFAQAVPNHVWASRPDGWLYWFNNQVYSYAGLAQGELDGESGWAAIVHPDDLPHAGATWAAALSSGASYRTEFRIRRADGAWRWFVVRAEPVRDAGGAIIHWVGANIDIDEIRQQGAELVRLNATLAELLAGRTAERDRLWSLSEDMLARADYQGNLSAVNPAWTKVLGYSEQDLLTNPYADIIHPENVETVVAALDAMSRNGQPTRFENRLLASNGVWKPVGWTVSPEPDGVHFIAIGRDLTEDKQRERELVLAQEQLRQSQKLEAVGQLTGGVAHDFNNLLTIIKSSTDLLRRPGLPEERHRRYIDAISDTVDRASKLTGQLLAFARRQALKPEAFDVPERIRAITDMLRTVVGSRIQIVTEAECTNCFVEADVSQFETAIVNMAVNARDAMDGEGRLAVSVRSQLDLPPLRGHAGGPGPFVVISIADTGSGIPDDKLSQIFEPFFTTKEVGKGTGLGLSQVYGFVKQSGGDVAVESELGRGATFTIYLPQVESGAHTRIQPHAASPSAEGRGLRVLVVEDNVEVGRFSTQVLQDLGFATTWAANGNEALKLLNEEGPFDAVFSDVVMPGMGGVELGREIRRRYPDLPVVLTSGYSQVLAQEGRHGFELLTKPYAAEELSRVLLRVTQGLRGR